VKEKNALAERLKGAEAARKRFDEELKRYATEKVTREEIRQSLEDEVRRLTQTVGQTEGEKREKEEQVARCEAYIDGMESKLQACQVFASAHSLCLFFLPSSHGHHDHPCPVCFPVTCLFTRSS
jgi:DNA repair exonuclease SbcCD ATPase subunit